MDILRSVQVVVLGPVISEKIKYYNSPGGVSRKTNNDPKKKPKQKCVINCIQTEKKIGENWYSN